MTALITPAARNTPAFSFLRLEVTGRCGLRCSHCYAGSGPSGIHEVMTGDDWRSVITQAAHLGVPAVPFTVGEPTLHPDFPALLAHAIDDAAAPARILDYGLDQQAAARDADRTELCW